MAMNNPLPPQHKLRRRRIHSVPQFAGELNVSERTVWRLIAAQKIRTIKVSIGRRGIPDSELERIEAGGLE
jgi:hypothetical protein